jgi:hypothetical protein
MLGGASSITAGIGGDVIRRFPNSSDPRRATAMAPALLLCNITYSMPGFCSKNSGTVEDWTSAVPLAFVLSCGR